MRRLTLWISMALIVVACNNVPATVVVVITPTPDPNVIVLTVTPADNSTSDNTNNNTGSSTQDSTISITQTNTEISTAPTPTPQPAISTIARPSETPDRNLQPIRADLYIAQQDFENGYMFWISSKKVIWVLFKNPQNPNATSGEWQSFPDSWQEGEPETDPAIVPPAERFQPKRGFGKLWRTEPGLRDALGWAITPEFELTTTYIYEPKGSYNDKGEWIAQPGEHFITSLSRQTYILAEAPQGEVRGMWRRLPQ